MVILRDAKISLVRLVIKPAKVKPSVVESVVTQLQGGLFGKCMRTVVSVSNYTEEVESEYTEYHGANLRKSTLQQITRNC